MAYARAFERLEQWTETEVLERLRIIWVIVDEDEGAEK